MGISAGRFGSKEDEMMKHLMLAILVTALAVGSAVAQAPSGAQGSCESKAVGKDGKPLVGAAKNSFITKCKRDACAPKAVGSDGKPLKGAAKNSFMAKCERES
jgi:hypothetical protein